MRIATASRRNDLHADILKTELGQPAVKPFERILQPSHQRTEHSGIDEPAVNGRFPVVPALVQMTRAFEALKGHRPAKDRRVNHHCASFGQDAMDFEKIIFRDREFVEVLKNVAGKGARDGCIIDRQIRAGG